MKNHIIPPDNCTGCALCANLCPKDAIRMDWNKEGFLVPFFEEDACSHCGLCEKRCLALHPIAAETPGKRVAYAAWNKDESIRVQSSSGGVFTAIAEYVIAKGGGVYGVEWQENYHARFGKALTNEELSRFRGSKYVQSEIGYTYRQIRAELHEGRMVLFVGMPCQVEALLAYLKNPCAGLITISLACHGVPSRLLWEKYRAEKEKLHVSPMVKVEFRNKKDGWVEFYMHTSYANGEQEYTLKHCDDYMKVFLSCIAMKKSCFKCRYSYDNSAVPQLGDISLADFWSLKDYHCDWDAYEGVSAVLCHSQKGIDIMNELHDRLIIHPEEFEIAQNPTKLIYGWEENVLTRLLTRRKKALRLLQKGSSLKQIAKLTEREISIAGIRFREGNLLLRSLVKIYRMFFPKNRLKIGILTEQLNHNYGGILQAYALQRAVEGLGMSPIHIHYALKEHRFITALLHWGKSVIADLLWRVGLLPKYPIPSRIQNKKNLNFIQKNIKRTRLLTPSNIDKGCRDIALCIIGSDQVWNERDKRFPMSFYYLENLSEEKRRSSIAYAASFGKDFWGYSTDLTDKCATLAQELKAISVREHSGIELCSTYLGCSAVQMPDPTMLLAPHCWKQVAMNVNRNNTGGGYMCTYILDWNEKKKKMIELLSEKLGLPIRNITANQENIASRRDLEPCGISEWLSNVCFADCMFTDSFHGSVFALIFNKPFICLGNGGRGMSRFDALLKTFHLEDRLYTDGDVYERMIRPIDWDSVNAILDLERGRGIQFLKKNLRVR